MDANVADGAVGDVPMQDADTRAGGTAGARESPEVGTLAAAIARDGADNAASGSGWDEQVTEELYDSMLREVHEETGLPRAVQWPSLHRRRPTPRECPQRALLPLEARVTAAQATVAFKDRQDRFEALGCTACVEELPALVGDGTRVMPGCHIGAAKLFEYVL